MARVSDRAGSLAVVIASVGRGELLGQVLVEWARQTVAPDRVWLSVGDTADLPLAFPTGLNVTTLIGPKGSCAQRNTALEAIGSDCAFVFFCDDDYVPSRYLVERIVTFFTHNPDVVGVSGTLLADGIHGPGIEIAHAREIVARHDALPVPPPVPGRGRYGLYGCNMAFRRDAIGSVRFDERLPLYGWQEDIDFSAQIRLRGRITGTNAFAGVHLGVKTGRTPGLRLGYSQVINPVYLARKGTMRSSYAWRIIYRNILANHWRALRPEPWVDRFGRVKGNWLACLDLLRGRITPERAARIQIRRP